MNRDDVLSAAREAGFSKRDLAFEDGLADSLERFAAIIEKRARESERQACAKVCEAMLGGYNWGSENADIYRAQDHRVRQCAEAIRARADK